MRSVTNFRRKNHDAIEGAKKEFLKDHSSIRLSHKKGRLQELQQIFISRKMKWEENPTRDNEKMLVTVLREIRQETQDNTLRIDANINANINVTIQTHIEQEIMKSLTLNDIIIARVASRMNINPRFLISRLHNSYYAKHSGFVRPDQDLSEQETTYPSAMVYNWKDIKAQHDREGDANALDAQWEEVPNDQEQVALSMKELLAQQIKAKQDQVNMSQERIDRNTAE